MKKTNNPFFYSARASFTVLIVLLFIPLFFHGPHFGLPWVKGGDEPHYLVLINSLIQDGDLDLKNNYESVHEGSPQAGKKFAGLALNHQVSWYLGGKRVSWADVYEPGDQWKKDAMGHPVPTLKPGVTVDVSGLPQYSGHPPGQAFLLAPFLWPFRGTKYVEPLALLCSDLAVILSAFLFFGILSRYNSNPTTLHATVLLVFLGTPLWNIGRTLFTESFLTALALAAFLLVIKRDSGFWPGFFIGLGILIKPVFLVLLPPLLWRLWGRRQWRAVGWILVGPVIATGLVLYLNDRMFGSPFRGAQPFTFGNPITGMLGLLFSWNHGLFPFAPVAVLAVLGWKKFWSGHKEEAFLFTMGFAGYFLVMACWDCWWGGWCYGPRLILPVLPFLMVPLVYCFESFKNNSNMTRFVILLLCGLSVAINFLGALDGYWDSHPFTLLFGNIS